MSEKSLTQRFDDSMSSFLRSFFIFFFRLKTMTWSHRNVVLNFFRSFLSLIVLYTAKINCFYIFPIPQVERKIRANARVTGGSSSINEDI